jgi:hypothetical protein
MVAKILGAKPLVITGIIASNEENEARQGKEDKKEFGRRGWDGST